MRKLLLVEDDRNLANLTKIALSKSGFEVSVLHEGTHIIEDVRKFKPDLIIMDFMLPQISGAEAVKILKKDADLKNIPVIFLTGLIAGEEEVAALGVNIAGEIYASVGKPYELPHLLKVIERTLNKARS